MIFKVRIGNELREWNEEHDTKTAYFQHSMFNKCETAEQYARRMVQWFNDTLRPGERVRHFVAIVEGED